MYSVSKEYKEIMDRPLRNVAYMTVSIGIINIEAQSNASVGGELSAWSNKKFPLTNRNVFGEYATMEQNLFKADGSMYFMPEKNGYASYFSNSGASSKNILGGVKVNLGSLYEIKGLTLDFGEFYPTKFNIVTDKDAYTYDNDNSKFVSNDYFGEITSFTVVPTEMIGGQQRLRLNGITIGVGITFDDSTIESANLKEYASTISEELPATDFNLTVFDLDNVFNVDDDNSYINFLETGQRVNVLVGLEHDNGTIEDIQMGNFALSNWSSERNKMSFTATDSVAFMDEVYTGGNTIHTRTLWDDAVSVLTFYGFEPDEYILDECLKDVTIKNPLPEVSCAQCLQLIANAGRCILFQNRNGQVCIRANFATVLDPEDFKITTTSQASWSKPNNIMIGSNYVYADMTRNLFSTDGSMYFMPEGSSDYLQTSFVSKYISDDDGYFTSNPNFNIKLPAGYTYYGLYVNFDGNAPKEMVVSTLYNGKQQETITFDNLSNVNLLSHEFKVFDEMHFEFTKASPNNRVLVNKVSFGDLSDYTLRKMDMLEKPVGYREKKKKSVSVKVFTFANNEEGVPEVVEDNVFSTKSLNSSGETVVFENQLISTQSHAKDIAEWLGNYYANNVSYDVTFRGEPRLNATDIIHMESDVVDNLQVEIEEHDFNYNGTFSGSLKLRRALKMM